MARCKYEKLEHQVSFDNGISWTPLETIKGDLIESGSSDCPDSGSEITKWVDLEGDYICEDKIKYKKQVLYVSYDGGSTWYIYFPTVYQKGEYIGVDDSFCNNKFEGHYTTSTYLLCDPLKIVKCDGDTILHQRDVRYLVDYRYPYSLSSCTIGDCVTRIDDFCFVTPNNVATTLESVHMPNTVTIIERYAFSGCTWLSDMNLSTSLTSIEEGAFKGCGWWHNINIPSGVTTINDYVFYGCGFESETILPNSITTIGNHSFEKCVGIAYLTIPDSVTRIGDCAFAQCGSIVSVDIGSGITSIGASAFTDSFSHPLGWNTVTIKATTPPSVSNDTFNTTYLYKIYVPMESENAYKTAIGWNNYAQWIQGVDWL